MAQNQLLASIEKAIPRRFWMSLTLRIGVRPYVKLEAKPDVQRMARRLSVPAEATQNHRGREAGRRGMDETRTHV